MLRQVHLQAAGLHQPNQYGSIAGDKAQCYTAVAASTLAEVSTIIKTHYINPQRDGKAELCQVAV